MSAEKFIQQIEQLGIIDDKVVAKIRKQVADPGKNVSAKAIAKFLIDKGQLTSAQAKKMLAKIQSDEGAVATPTTQHEELTVNQGVEKDHDTGSLIGEVTPTAAEPVEVEPVEVEPVEIEPVEVEPVGVDATMLDMNQVIDAEPEIVEVEDVHDVSPDQVERMQQTIVEPILTDDPAPEPLAAGAPPMESFEDPFATADSGDPTQPTSASQEMAIPGFKGKKNAAKPWSSKWLFIAPAILGILAIVGFLLILFFKTKPADELWELANDAHVRGDYSVAMETFDEFMASHPGDDRVDTAKVYRVRSLLAQSFAASQWKETYTRAKNKLPEIEPLEEFGEIRETLADILPKTARGFAEQAIKEDDIEKKEGILGQVNDAMKLVETPSYVPTKFRDRPVVAKVIEQVEDMRRQINREIKMEKTYVKVLGDINQMVSDGKTNEAIQSYLDLTMRFPKLKPRVALQKAVGEAAVAEQKNVKNFSPELATSTDPISSPISRTLLISSLSNDSKTAVGLEEDHIAYLIDGSVYMINCGTGKLMWRQFVGYRTSIEPFWTDNSREKVILANSNTGELACHETVSGKLVWRTEIGVGFDQPRLMDRAVILSAFDGQLMRINVENGAVESAVKLPQNLTTGCTSNSSFVFQPGEHTNLYTFSAKDLTCQSVTFVGADHIPGSITVPPHIVAGHLFLLVNGGDYTNLHVYRIEEDGQTLTEVQNFQRFTRGIVNTPMLQMDRWLVVASDTGHMKLMEVNKTEMKTPVTQAASFNFTVDEGTAAQMRNSGLRHFIMSYSGRVWIANQGLTRFKVIKSQGKFERDLVTNGEDTFLGPVVRKGDYALTLRRRNGSSLASVACIDPRDHTEVWRNDFSAPLAGPVFRDGNAGFVTSAQGDTFAITRELMSNGKVEQPTYRGSKILQDIDFKDGIEAGAGKRFFFGNRDEKRVMFYDKDSATIAQIFNLVSPANNPSCAPVALGDLVIMASRKGQVSLIKPGSGEVALQPFQPEVQPGNDIRWCRPAVMSESSFVIADGDQGMLYLLKAMDSDVQKVAQFEHQDKILTALTKVGIQVLAVDNNGTHDRLVSFDVGEDSIQKAAAIELPADRVAGPYEFPGGVALVLANDSLAFYESTQFATGAAASGPKWTLPLKGRLLAGKPVKLGDNVLLTLSSGELMVVSPDGNLLKTLSLGQPLSGEPIIVKDDLLIGGRDGHIHIVSLDKLK